MPTIFVALLLAAALGTGLAAASTHALPGNPLYAFKTGISERVASVAAITPDAQAQLHLLALQTRLQEITALIPQDALTQNTITQATIVVRADITDITAQIHLYEKNNEHDRAQTLKNDLKGVLGQQLVNLTSNQNPSTQTALIPLITTLRSTLDTLASN